MEEEEEEQEEMDEKRRGGRGRARVRGGREGGMRMKAIARNSPAYSRVALPIGRFRHRRDDARSSPRESKHTFTYVNTHARGTHTRAYTYGGDSDGSITR